MDPLTTLFTFMVKTNPDVQSVHLLGSWDNFSKSYLMERDVRRDHGQWRGCYSFKDIICDGDSGVSPRRDGGLKMGATYYYYYEIDGARDMHDTEQPSTTHCPYLPGQKVNTLEVPVEQVLRKRSASLNSLRTTDFKTMNPEDKYITPQPAAIPTSSHFRIGSSSLTSSRSMSPLPSWRRLFGKGVSSRGRQAASAHQDDDRSTTPDYSTDDSRSVVSSHGTRSRDISPESLRRFLVEDVSSGAVSTAEERPFLWIPEDIIEENEDDDNFATSAVSEHNPYSTSLSPPPAKRPQSDSSMPTVTNESQKTLTKIVTDLSRQNEVQLCLPFTPSVMTTARCESRFSLSSSTASEWLSTEPRSPEDEMHSFYDSCDEDEDEDDALSSNEDTFQYIVSGRTKSREQNLATIPSYSLPRSENRGKHNGQNNKTAAHHPAGSPELIARSDSGVPIGNTLLLAAPGDHGIDDFANELSWMVDIISSRLE